MKSPLAWLPLLLLLAYPLRAQPSAAAAGEGAAAPAPVVAPAVAASFAPPRAPSVAGVVSRHGRLKVVGAQLCDQHGDPIQLTGMSAHMIQNYPWSAETVKHLVSQYGNTLVRAAMYTGQKGYLADPANMQGRLQTIVNAAIANDVYVIIDWHGVGGNPNEHAAEARKFFHEMAATYAAYPHVIFELYNEPTVEWPAIKAYAEDLIPVIRAEAPDSVIIVGTPKFCSQPQAAEPDRLKFENLLYTLHFYCGDAKVENDGQSQRDNVARLIERGFPIFVSEWGTSNHTGDGGPYPVTAQKWLDFMAQKKLSWANWSLTRKAEGSAFLKPTASLDGPWTDDDLTPAGLFMKDKFR